MCDTPGLGPVQCASAPRPFASRAPWAPVARRLRWSPRAARGSPHGRCSGWGHRFLEGGGGKMDGIQFYQKWCFTWCSNMCSNQWPFLPPSVEEIIGPAGSCSHSVFRGHVGHLEFPERPRRNEASLNQKQPHPRRFPSDRKSHTPSVRDGYRFANVVSWTPLGPSFGATGATCGARDQTRVFPRGRSASFRAPRVSHCEVEASGKLLGISGPRF